MLPKEFEYDKGRSHRGSTRGELKIETLRVEKEGHFCWLKLNRPEAMNALNTQMAKDLIAAAQEIALDRDVWVVGITTTSDTFGVGADLKERKDMTLEEIAAQRVLFTRAMIALKNLPQPVLAGVKGFALGGGFEIALMADIMIAGENAQFGLPEVRVGLIPGNGGTQTLSRLIGKSRAKEMIFTGKRIDARKALEIGIVNQIVPVDRVEEAVRNLAEEISANAPVAVRQAKKAIEMGMNADLDYRNGD